MKTSFPMQKMVTVLPAPGLAITARPKSWLPAITLATTCVLASASAAAMEDSMLQTGVNVDQLEWRDTNEGDVAAWDAKVWLGDDLNKLILNSEGEYRHSDSRHDNKHNNEHDSATEEAELQLLYSRAIAAYWNFQAGWRGDLQPTPERHWLALGLEGLAPWFIDVNATLFVGNEDRTALRLTLEHELMLTQRLALVPEIELNVYGRNDPETATGAGLSDVAAGMRLHYEITREFAPYVGVHYWKQYGNTARFSRVDDEKTDGAEFVAGIHFWY